MKIEDFIRKRTDGISKIKLPGGVVGKTCYVLMSVAVALAAIVLAVRTEYVAYGAIGALLIIVLPILWRLLRFAERQPQVAILEGIEYIAYQQIQLAQKGIGDLPPTPPEPPKETLELPTTEQAMLQLPDPVHEVPKRTRPKTNG